MLQQLQVQALKDLGMTDLSGTMVRNMVDMLDKRMSMAKSEAFLLSVESEGSPAKMLPVCMKPREPISSPPRGVDLSVGCSVN